MGLIQYSNEYDECSGWHWHFSHCCWENLKLFSYTNFDHRVAPSLMSSNLLVYPQSVLNTQQSSNQLLSLKYDKQSHITIMQCSLCLFLLKKIFFFFQSSKCRQQSNGWHIYCHDTVQIVVAFLKLYCIAAAFDVPVSVYLQWVEKKKSLKFKKTKQKKTSDIYIFMGNLLWCWRKTNIVTCLILNCWNDPCTLLLLYVDASSYIFYIALLYFL